MKQTDIFTLMKEKDFMPNSSTLHPSLKSTIIPELHYKNTFLPINDVGTGGRTQRARTPPFINLYVKCLFSLHFQFPHRVSTPAGKAGNAGKARK